jgi:hypothetical protein
MQSDQRLAQLRQELRRLYQPNLDDLAIFLSGHPLIKGSVYTLNRKCSKPSCRCARGEHHAAVVLTASMGGKTRLWTIPEECLEEIRQGTENYRRFRKARAAFLKKCGQRQTEMRRMIDAIEKARTRQP